MQRVFARAPLPVLAAAAVMVLNGWTARLYSVTVAGLVDGLTGHAPALPWTAAFIGVVVVGLGANTLREVTDAWVSNTATLRAQAPVLRCAASVPIVRFLDPAFHDRPARASADLSGRLKRWVEGALGLISLARLVLRPQGVGAALYLAERGLLPPGGGYTVVVDVGTRTTDIGTAALRDLSPVLDLCCSFGVGVATAANSLALAAQRLTGHLPPFDIAAAALREPQPWHGSTVGGLDEAAPHLGTLADAIRREVQRVFGDAAQQVAAVAFVGGGAALLGERLRDLLPGRGVALTDHERLHANAIGFGWAAERAARA